MRKMAGALVLAAITVKESAAEPAMVALMQTREIKVSVGEMATVKVSVLVTQMVTGLVTTSNFPAQDGLPIDLVLSRTRISSSDYFWSVRR